MSSTRGFEPITPSDDAAPVARSTRWNVERPGEDSDAKPKLPVAVPVASSGDQMSKPTALRVSVPSAPTVFSVPLLGGS